MSKASSNVVHAELVLELTPRRSMLFFDQNPSPSRESLPAELSSQFMYCNAPVVWSMWVAPNFKSTWGSYNTSGPESTMIIPIQLQGISKRFTVTTCSTLHTLSLTMYLHLEEVATVRNSSDNWSRSIYLNSTPRHRGVSIYSFHYLRLWVSAALYDLLSF